MSNILKVQRESQDQSKTISLKPIYKPTTKQQDQEQETLNLKANAERMFKEAQEKLQQAKQESERIIEQANQQLHEEQEAWESEKEKLFEQLKAEAFEVGFQDGKVEAEKQHQAYVDEASSLINLAKQEYAEIIDKSHEDILQISLNATEKILGYVLEDNQENFTKLVQQALLIVKDKPKIDLHVHVSDYEGLLQHKEELTNLLSDQADLTIYPSKEVNRHGCLIDTPNGQIDVGVDSQLNELKVKLLDLLEEAKTIEG
ncbi:flagellar assembly protein FliH [Salinibacillus xinjiangensis]|uniref:flagellar assembly protein FliH n=1 Tax=Salinibacillus xinjiangensis TaxID=1229268 RepID=UPI0018917C23|nr:flagellar assembly protein FliH [Salinibacillus xinjiangensis]